MKNILGLIAGLICTSVVEAEVIVANNPVVDTVGFYSDAFDSKGAYTYAQSGAQGFSLEDNHLTSSIRWWGSVNGFNNQGLTNIDCFQIIVWNPDFESTVASQRIDLDQISITDTGEYNFFGQPVYEFYVPFAVQLAAGSYFMNIGAQLNDTTGDQFIWSQGQAVNQFWFTDSNGQYDWGDWRPLPTFIGNTAGGAFQLNAPTPGAIALMGLAGFIGQRRRR